MFTIDITGHTVIVAVLVLVMTCIAVFDIVTCRKLKFGVFVWWAFWIFCISLVSSVGIGGITKSMDTRAVEAAILADARAAKAVRFDAMVESIPKEWNPITSVLKSTELRVPAKMVIVRDSLQEKIFPELTISQQNYLVEFAFRCSSCGCGGCNAFKDQLSEILAVHVNPFAK